ncbi:MAG TPA: nuclear transport factor 2 family protein [Novosphingobium sp.]
MPRFDVQQLAIAYELEQRLYEFVAEMDVNNYANIAEFYTEDAVFIAGPNRVTPRSAIVQFYETRNENVKKYQKGGARTGRHTFVNVRVEIADENNATLRFVNVSYGAEGPTPASGLGAPSMVADCVMTCRREADDVWRFSEFAPSAALIGEDDFMKLMLSLKDK